MPRSGSQRDVSGQAADRFARDIGPAVLDELAVAAEASGLLRPAMHRLNAAQTICFIGFWPVILNQLFPILWQSYLVDACIFVVSTTILLFAVFKLKAAVDKTASGTVRAKCVELGARFPGTVWTA